MIGMMIYDLLLSAVLRCVCNLELDTLYPRFYIFCVKWECCGFTGSYMLVLFLGEQQQDTVTSQKQLQHIT